MKSKSKNIWKRGEYFYFRAKVNGKIYSQSLGKISRDAAIGEAKDLLMAIYENRLESVRKRMIRPGWAKMEEIYSAYMDAMASVGKVGERTGRNYCGSMGVLIRAGLGVDDDGAQSSGVLTGDLVDRYERTVLQGCPPAARDSAQRSIASTVRQAKALFSRRAIRLAYKDLALPDLASFLGAHVDTVRSAPVLPDADLWRRTMAAAEEWFKMRSPLYQVFLLSYYFGLRLGESVAARWDWIHEVATDAGTIRVLDVPAMKTDQGRRLQVAADVWARMQTFETAGGEWILSGGTGWARRNLAGRDFAAAMRALGYDRERFKKCAHTLRKMIGSVIFTEAGPAQAQAYLGHAELRTTTDYYAKLLRLPPAMGIGAGQTKAPGS